MSPLPTKAAIKAVFGIMNARNLEQLNDILDVNAVFYFPGTPPIKGAQKIKTFLKVLFRRYPQLSFTTKRLIAEDNCAAVEWTNKGVDRTGELYTNEGVTVVELKNNRIVYISDTFKDTSFTMR